MSRAATRFGSRHGAMDGGSAFEAICRQHAVLEHCDWMDGCQRTHTRTGCTSLLPGGTKRSGTATLAFFGPAVLEAVLSACYVRGWALYLHPSQLPRTLAAFLDWPRTLTSPCHQARQYDCSAHSGQSAGANCIAAF